MEEKQNNKSYYIPPNYEDNLITSSGRSSRNVIEAVIFFAFFVLIFAFLPISIRYRIILIILFGGPAALLGFIGIEHCSVTEYLGLVLKFKSNPNKINKVDLFQKKDIETKEIVREEEEKEPLVGKTKKNNKKHKKRGE